MMLWTTAREPLTLNVSRPSGYLAGLLTGDVDVRVEGLRKSPDLRISYVYTNSGGPVHYLCAPTVASCRFPPPARGETSGGPSPASPPP